jgi:hypothetical protein
VDITKCGELEKVEGALLLVMGEGAASPGSWYEQLLPALDSIGPKHQKSSRQPPYTQKNIKNHRDNAYKRQKARSAWGSNPESPDVPTDYSLKEQGLS